MFVEVFPGLFCGLEGAVILVGSGSVFGVVVVSAIVFELVLVAVWHFGVVEVDEPLQD